MTNYELCHASYRGNIEKEIDAAHEVLRKYKKSCVDAVKELRYETDMPMTECSNMLRCLQRDAEIERIQVENAKLRELVRHMYECMGNIDADGNHECDSCEYDNEEGKCDYERLMRELEVIV